MQKSMISHYAEKLAYAQCEPDWILRQRNEISLNLYGDPNYWRTPYIPWKPGDVYGAPKAEVLPPAKTVTPKCHEVKANLFSEVRKPESPVRKQESAARSVNFIRRIVRTEEITEWRRS